MKKRFLLLLLAMLVVASCLTTGVMAITTSEVVTKLDSIMTQTTYTPGYAGSPWGEDACWRFANEVSKQLFGEGIPNNPNGYLLDGISNFANWNLVGTATASNDSVLSLLKTAQPGDVLQFKSTAATWQHTSIVYNVTSNSISIYEHRNETTGLTLRTFNYNTSTELPNLFSESGVGNYNSSSSYGLSVYRHNSVSDSSGSPSKPDAPSSSVVTVNYRSETITYNSNLYEVSGDSNFSSVIASGAKIQPGSYLYVRVKASGSTPASDGTGFGISTRSVVFNKVTFNYTTETYNSASGLEYSLDNSTWKSCTGELPLSAVSGYDTVYFRIAATDTSFASDSYSVTVPSRGNAPSGIEKTDETVDQRNDGTITGVTEEMQYRIANGSWADCPESGTISNLADGSYEIRYKGSDSSLASNSAAVVIAQGVPQTFDLDISAPEFDSVVYNYEQPDAKALTITSSGNTDSTIASVTVDTTNFVIGTGSTTVPYGQSINDWTIRPIAGLEAGTYTGTVTVAYNNDAKATDTVNITVEKAPQDAPVMPMVTNYSYTSIELKALEPNINGAVVEYRVNGGEWQTNPVFEGLKAGTRYTFEQRYAEVGSYLASLASKSFSFYTQFYTATKTHKIYIAETENGSVDTNFSNAGQLSSVIITVTPDEGYIVGSVTVTGPDGYLDVVYVSDTTYRFKMPDGEVTINVSFIQETDEIPFTDVLTNAWYYDVVSYAYANGLMDGVSATQFDPKGTMTRAMVWTILARIDGETITGSDWASTVRVWAMAKGVSDGTNPNSPVTREQLVTMLWRYAGESYAADSLSAWTDAASVSDWAEIAVIWAVNRGIITGMTSTTIAPQSSATRAQCAAILMRYLTNS